MPERLILYIVVFSLFSSCAPQTEKAILPVEIPDTFYQAGSAEVTDRWWTTFEDEQLNDLVDTALKNNFNIKTAWQRLRAAQAVVDRESAALLPTLEGSAQGGIERPQSDFVGGENIRIGLNSVYEVDLWGRINSRIEAEEYRAQASLEDYQTAAISLSAEVVRSWYQLAAARQQLDLIERQVQTNEQVLELMNNRFGTGQIRGVDIIRQRQLLEATEEQKTYAEADIETIRHQLAVLTGAVPQKEMPLIRDSLPELPPLPQAGVPVDLIERRPDVQRAFHLLKAADRDLAAAISNQYPRLTINATAALRSENVKDLFGNWATSLAGNLLVPIFYGGELSAEVDRNEAVKQQRLFEYGQTVLTAFQEVENALISEQKQKEAIDRLREQLNLSRKAYEQLRIEYFNGSGDYLDVLTALDEVQLLRRDLISAELSLIDYRISLYRALAGAIETNRANNE